MKKMILAVAAVTLLSSPAFAAAGAKSYQVTGPVLEMNDQYVTVQKGSDKWQINRGTATFPADVKVGSKVTIMYTMTATDVTAKDAAVKTAPKK